jgi:ferric-dicitrate binding protein FerR (iron transport regulator)
VSERPDDGAEREVEGWLRDLGAPPPRPAFRDDLRARFVGGELAPAEEHASLLGKDARSADAMIEDLLKAQAPPPPSRAAFRDDLRARFLLGDLRERVPPAPAHRGPTAPRGPWLRLVAGGLAAAAAIWLVALFLLPDGPSWRGLRTHGEGPVVVDGRELVPRDLAELGAAFAAARVVDSRDRRVELVHDDALVLALLPGTEIEALADGSDGEMRFALRRGEVYLKTHEGYGGPSVVVETSDMDMRMTGTVVGVMKLESLSCICVARGTVDVTPRSDGEARVCKSDVQHIVFTSGDGMVKRLSENAETPHVSELLEFADESF